MGHLDDASTIPLWGSLGVAGLFFLVYGAAWIWFIVKRRIQIKQTGYKSTGPVFQAAAAVFVMILIVLMDVTLILQQTEFTRSDDTTVVWGRWAFYIPVFFVIAWMITLYQSRVSDNESTIQEASYVASTAIWFSGFGAAALLLATISSNNNIWFWFAVAASSWIITLVMYVLSYVWGNKKLKPWLAGTMITLITLAYLIFLVFWAIGRSGGNVGGFSFAAERWLYFAAEFLLIIYITVIVLTEGKDVSNVIGFSHIRRQIAILSSSQRTSSTPKRRAN